LWLQAEGFEAVYALRGGLLAWEQAGYPTVPFRMEQNLVALNTANIAQPASSPSILTAVQATAHAHTFLPGLVGSYAVQHGAPTRKQLTVLFVDIADSTVTVVNRPPEEVLTIVQQFMEVVTDVALAHCGDVKDYEGDGALLYFESVTEATQAALAIRDQFARTQAAKAHPLQARFSLNIGDVTIGVIGTALRRSVALIGPSINLASRLLKQIPPGGIIATAAVVEHLQQEAPQLAQQFTLWNDNLELKGFTNERVAAYHVPEDKLKMKN
jgi:class 3 adenylate cyclase